MQGSESIVILTGAGISAESGLATFRGPDGLWEGHRVEDVCTPEALARDPALVHEFYDQRRAALKSVEPNAAHRALARLDAEWPGELLIVTQNVDDLHERAGAKRLLHMHGELLSALCSACGASQRWFGPLPPHDPVRPELVEGLPSLSALEDQEQGSDELSPNGDRGCCRAPSLRPDIVFFGEMPYEMDRIERALSAADLFISIGTSGAVYPAAGFVRLAAAHGARTLELNLEPSEGSGWFEESRLGPASRLVPEWVASVLA